MEFFKIVRVKTSETVLKELLTLENLDLYSSELLPLEKPETNEMQIGGIWGEFTLTRHPITGGIRFALQECPNALTWTVTTGFPPAPESIVLHLTVNRKEREQDFIDEIEEFLEDFANGLQKFFASREYSLAQN